MANIFTKERVKTPRTNFFDLSHDRKMTTEFGRLTPTLVQECIPGDLFTIRPETLIRFAPMVSPVMHRIKVFTHYFFVPNRIIWDEFEDWYTGGEDGTANPPIPRMNTGGDDATTFQTGSLADYLGLPTGVPIWVKDFNVLPFCAYQRIFYDYYRDQNLDQYEKPTVSSGNGSYKNEKAKLNTMRYRAWRHDYFTSCLPSPQKGPEVTIPLFDTPEDVQVVRNDDTPNPSLWQDDQSRNVSVPNEEIEGGSLGRLYAKTSDLVGTASSITSLRTALKLQELFEKLNRGGSRMFEVLRSFFGVRNQDIRLQRPEFIGGVSQNVHISEVLQTSESSQTPQANMAGHGLSASMGKRSTYHVKEPGYIIGITSIMPETAYQQGIPRHWSRSDRFDYYWPQFAHIGEQEVLQKELFVDPDGDSEKNDSTFGYIPRYSELRYNPSTVHGDFRSSLDFWHLGRIFDNAPQLNSDFIYLNNQTADSLQERIFAVGDADFDPLWMHVYNDVKARRPLPKFGTPML